MLDIDKLRALTEAVPPHVVNNGFVLSQNPVAGDWYLYSDNLRGMGRQWIAAFPAGKHYFGGLAQFMEAVSPITVRQLLDRVAAAEAGMEAAIAEAEKRGAENAARDMRERAVEAVRAVYVYPSGPSDDADHARRKAVFEASQAVADLPLKPAA